MSEWQRSDDWVGSEIEDSFVMVNIETGNYVALNSTAAAIWNALETPLAEDAIVGALTAAFDVDEAQCRAALPAALESMRKLDLVSHR